MLRNSLALFQKVFAESIHDVPMKNRLKNVEASSSSTWSLRLFTLKERERRIQQAKEIDISVSEDLDKQLATQKIQRS